MKVFPKSNFEQISSVSHPVFRVVEKEFHSWLKGSNPIHEYREQYFGSPEFGGGCLSMKGAIKDAIEMMLNEANETGKPVNIGSFDLAQAFES